jgi:hypothetical protein
VIIFLVELKARKVKIINLYNFIKSIIERIIERIIDRTIDRIIGRIIDRIIDRNGSLSTTAISASFTTANNRTIR